MFGGKKGQSIFPGSFGKNTNSMLKGGEEQLVREIIGP
jgi:hypothetical protein